MKSNSVGLVFTLPSVRTSMSRCVSLKRGVRGQTSYEVKRPPAPNKPNNRVRHRCRTPKNVNTKYTSTIKPRNLRNVAQTRPRTRNVRGHCSSHTSQNVGPMYLVEYIDDGCGQNPLEISLAATCSRCHIKTYDGITCVARVMQKCGAGCKTLAGVELPGVRTCLRSLRHSR